MRASPRSSERLISRARPPLALVVIIAMIAITAVAVVASAIAATPIEQPQPIDSQLFGRAGGLLLTGRWGSVFSSSLVQAGPIELAFWGIPWLLGAAGLSAWITLNVIACTLFSVVVGLTLASALRAFTALDRPTRAVLAVAATAVLAVSGVPALAVAAGHPAEVVIPLLWMLSATLARADRPLLAAVVLASTSGWELWGLLGLPVLLLAPRITPRMVGWSALGGLGVVAVLFVPFVLAAPFPMFGYRWTIDPGSLVHRLFPHLATFPWPLRVAQAALSVGAGAAIARLIRRREGAFWVVPLAICVLRLITDPVLAGYYLATPALLTLVGVTLGLGRRAASLASIRPRQLVPSGRARG